MFIARYYYDVKLEVKTAWYVLNNRLSSSCLAKPYWYAVKCASKSWNKRNQSSTQRTRIHEIESYNTTSSWIRYPKIDSNGVHRACRQIASIFSSYNIKKQFARMSITEVSRVLWWLDIKPFSLRYTISDYISLWMSPFWWAQQLMELVIKCRS